MEFRNSNVLGLMSGTSLDGLDMALCKFTPNYINKTYNFDVLHTKSVAYDTEWVTKLSEGFYLNSENLTALSLEFGYFLADQILTFQAQCPHPIHLIGSHGHTIFHKPTEGFTLQIGDGKTIRDVTGIPTVCNFRAQDVKLGGQGAPLVPIGDELIYSEFDFCLNLGGFANLSWKQGNKRLACDIGPCNMLLNTLSGLLDKPYDSDGNLAKSGNVIPTLLEKWNSIHFYSAPYPKSLGREWYHKHFDDDLKTTTNVRDALRTSVEHISDQIAAIIKNLSNEEPQKLFITGGGAYNRFLIETLQKKLPPQVQIVIPDATQINFKEAIIFAFLAYLRIQNKNNVLASVTGAQMDHCSGDVYGVW